MLMIRPVKKWAQLFCQDLSLLLFLKLIKQILGSCVSACRRMDFCMTREADTGPFKVLPCVRFRHPGSLGHLQGSVTHGAELVCFRKKEVSLTSRVMPAWRW